MCRRRRERRDPLVFTLGKAAYALYQDRQQQTQQRQVAEVAYQPSGRQVTEIPPKPSAFITRSLSQEQGVMVREKEPRPQVNDSHDNEAQGPRDVAPPSYEDTVGSQPRSVAAIPGDNKRQIPAPKLPNNHVDDSSDTSSVFETTGVLTPTTEAELAQQRKDGVARQGPTSEHSDLYGGSARGGAASHPRSEAAEIANIAHWLSQHDSQSVQARERAREEHERELRELREVEQLRQELSRASVQEGAPDGAAGASGSSRDRFARDQQRRTRLAEKLEALETKHAIKRAYRQEKRELRAAYRQEKDAVRASKAQLKAELKAWK